MKRVFIFLLLLSSAIQAQQNYTAILDKALLAQVNVNEFSGTVLVAKKGKIIYEKAVGLANRELNVSNTIETKFQIGSITKQFTAAAILQLVETNKLTLDDKLSKYFPDFPKGDSVTIHMLLNHTSGIKNYTDIKNFMQVMSFPYKKDSVLAYFKNQPYDFSPGKQISYSNSGYFLLGYIIEKVTGQSYSSYLLKNVLQKANMQNTMVNKFDTILAHRAAGYTKRPSGWWNASYMSMEFAYSAGALISTVKDLYEWDKSLISGKIFSPSMLEKMTTPYKGGYGYGLGIDSQFNHKRIAHPGGLPGFLSSKAYFPADDVHIVVLSNNESNATAILDMIAAIIFDQKYIPPYKHTEVKIDSNKLVKYVGSYKGPSDTLRLYVKGGKLLRVSKRANAELKFESNHKFFYADGLDLQVQFYFTKDERFQRAEFISAGLTYPLKKLD